MYMVVIVDIVIEKKLANKSDHITSTSEGAKLKHSTRTNQGHIVVWQT
jgi:hypothetical protein